jgi:predicted Zn-dependent peptidase
VEEFKETCLNEPYGDVWHHISELAYKEHPYRWPTIGLEPKHVEDAEMQDVKDFFFNFYRPNNAILVVAGNVKPKKALQLAEKWFGDIPAGEVAKRRLPVEPQQREFREKTVESKVPVDAIYLVFHTCSRTHPDFYAVDLLSDVLASGASSRLYRRLLKEKKLFSHIDCYITASNDPGLLIVEGKPTNGVSMADAEKAVWEELEQLIASPISKSELEKIVNKSESSLVFSEVSVLNKAINLAFFELVGDASIINRETSLYQNVTVEEMQRVAKEVLRRDNCSKLIYKSTMPVGEMAEDDEEEDEEED